MESRDDIGNVILEVKDLKMYFPIYRGVIRKLTGYVKAVDGVSFFLREGEVLGLVGESGCGKTTLGRTILRLYDPTSGEIRFRSYRGDWIDVARISQKDMKPLRSVMRMIFQDPFSSLNPRFTVKDIISEPLIIHGIAKGKEAEAIVAELMRKVGLDPSYMRRYPHEFSGGQRQRIGIARALVLRPKFVVGDEPVSALDVSVGAQIVNLLKKLQRDFGLTYLFISHSMPVVRYLCDRIAVMRRGEIVELGTSEEITSRPQHEYTRTLLAATPEPSLHIKS